VIYAGTDTGLMMSADSGESWASVASNIGPTQLLVVNPKDQTILYAGGPGGLFEIASPAATAANWQIGMTASHFVPTDAATGTWTINGLRAHLNETDHTAGFVPISATITVSPSK
jgi:hypothetical protein